MIGQEQLLNTIDMQIKEHKYPRFSILVGPSGGGKKLIAKHIAKELDAQIVNSEGKVEDVRQIIKLANSTFITTVYVFTDVEKMSSNAENALLKFLEEPPNNAYVILTTQSEYSLLDTIRSRGVIYHLNPYTPEEIEDYLMWYIPLPQTNIEEFIRLFTDLCETPGDVKLLASMNAEDFYNYVELVVDNIDSVIGANALKIGGKIALKSDDSDKYDLRMFFRAFIDICLKKRDVLHAKWIEVTNRYLRQLSIKGINKSMLFDSWVLDIREITFIHLNY